MLDFYLIADLTSTSNHVISELDYLGGIDYEEFEQLQDEQIIEAYLDYYKDFRWTSEQIVSKIELINKTKKNAG